MPRSHRTAATLATVAALAGATLGTSLATAPAALAAKEPSVTVNPKSPIVDDSLSVSMAVKTRLKAGYHYKVMLVGDPGSGCSWSVLKSVKARPAKGKKLSFTLSPEDDEVHEEYEWCQGKATIFISSAKNGKTTGGKNIATKDIRFRAKP